MENASICSDDTDVLLSTLMYYQMKNEGDVERTGSRLTPGRGGPIKTFDGPRTDNDIRHWSGQRHGKYNSDAVIEEESRSDAGDLRHSDIVSVSKMEGDADCNSIASSISSSKLLNSSIRIESGVDTPRQTLNGRKDRRYESYISVSSPKPFKSSSRATDVERTPSQGSYRIANDSFRNEQENGIEEGIQGAIGKISSTHALNFSYDRSIHNDNESLRSQVSRTPSNSCFQRKIKTEDDEDRASTRSRTSLRHSVDEEMEEEEELQKLDVTSGNDSAYESKISSPHIRKKRFSSRKKNFQHSEAVKKSEVNDDKMADKIVRKRCYSDSNIDAAICKDKVEDADDCRRSSDLNLDHSFSSLPISKPRGRPAASYFSTSTPNLTSFPDVDEKVIAGREVLRSLCIFNPRDKEMDKSDHISVLGSRSYPGSNRSYTEDVALEDEASLMEGKNGNDSIADHRIENRLVEGSFSRTPDPHATSESELITALKEKEQKQRKKDQQMEDLIRKKDSEIDGLYRRINALSEEKVALEIQLKAEMETALERALAKEKRSFHAQVDEMKEALSIEEERYGRAQRRHQLEVSQLKASFEVLKALNQKLRQEVKTCMTQNQELEEESIRKMKEKNMADFKAYESKSKSLTKREKSLKSLLLDLMDETTKLGVVCGVSPSTNDISSLKADVDAEIPAEIVKDFKDNLQSIRNSILVHLHGKQEESINISKERAAIDTRDSGTMLLQMRNEVKDLSKRVLSL